MLSNDPKLHAAEKDARQTAIAVVRALPAGITPGDERSNADIVRAVSEYDEISQSEWSQLINRHEQFATSAIISALTRLAATAVDQLAHVRSVPRDQVLDELAQSRFMNPFED